MAAKGKNDKKFEDQVGLPMRPFLYTLDQIEFLLQISHDSLMKDYLHFEGRSVGARPLHRMGARNIAPEGQTPEWRVSDRELARWLAKKGWRVYLRGWNTH